MSAWSTTLRGVMLELLTPALEGYTPYDSPIAPWSDDELPAFAVYSGDATCEARSLTACTWDRTETVCVEAITKGISTGTNAAGDAALAAAVDALETVIRGTLETAGAFTSLVRPTRCQVAKGRDSDGQFKVGKVTVVYSVVGREQFVPAGDSGTPLAAIHVAIDLINPGNGPDGTPEGAFVVNTTETP